MESLTLNLYGIAPQSEQKYINAVVGLSVLRFDHKHFGKLTGERNGKQIFTAINFRNFDTYKDFNFSPSGRITYGLTHLDDFTNFVSTKILQLILSTKRILLKLPKLQLAFYLI